MTWVDWFNLGLPALLTAGIAAIFFYGVWTDALQPWLYRRHERRRLRKLFKEVR